MSTKMLLIIIGIIIFAGGTLSAANLPQNIASEQKAYPSQQPMAKQEVLGTSVVSSDVKKSVYENVASSQEHTTFLKLLKAADLTNTLQGKKTYTVFAATDSAFNKLPEGTITKLLKTENKSQLQNLLQSHIIAGIYQTGDFADKLTLKTINGQTIILNRKEGSWYLNEPQGANSRIEKTDGISRNGTIHVINTVLLPNY